MFCVSSFFAMRETSTLYSSSGMWFVVQGESSDFKASRGCMYAFRERETDRCCVKDRVKHAKVLYCHPWYLLDPSP